MVRTSCLPHGLIFPTRNNIQSAKKIFHPQILSQEVKSSVHMGELLEETALSLIRVSNCAVQDGDTFKVIGKFGVDGSGSHKLRHQLINENLVNLETPHLDPTKASSFLLTCYCPLEFKVSEHILWENPAPNSTAFARPVSLSRAKEEREVLIGELEEIFPYIKEDYTSEQTIDGKNVQICFKTECSMVDGKMVSLLQGDSGAFCHLCTSTRSDANDLQQINNGFIINKDYESCKDAWEKLQRGDISYTSVERYGQCHESIAKCNLHFFLYFTSNLDHWIMHKRYYIIWLQGKKFGVKVEIMHLSLLKRQRRNA